jgi:predicted DNA-binding WGR domain protein/cell wall assembly regulator SMI1
LRRFELVEGASSKFWEIDVQGSGFTVRFGRIGTNGQEQVKSFGTPEATHAAAQKLIAEKVKKGYTEQPVGGASAAPAVAEPAPAAPSPDEQHEMLARLDSWLQKNRPSFLKSARPGASPEEIGKLETSVGKPLPETLKAFLAWRGESRQRFQDNYALMSIKEITGERKGLNQLLDAGEFDHPTWWRKDWIPFLANGSGDFLCVDLGGTFNGVPGQVLEYWHDYGDRTVLYPSFEAWLTVSVETLEAGAWDDEDGGFFTPDEEAVKDACARICPGYPKDHSADEETGPKKKARKPKAPEITGQMTEETARRLLPVWCGKRGLYPQEEMLRPRETGYQAITRHEEILWDPDRKAVFVYKDLGPAGTLTEDPVWKEMLDKERERLRRADPQANIEVRQSRFRQEVDRDPRLACVLAREFGDPAVTDTAFLDSLGALSKVIRYDWDLKFSWAVQAEWEKRG